MEAKLTQSVSPSREMIVVIVQQASHLVKMAVETAIPFFMTYCPAVSSNDFFLHNLIYRATRTPCNGYHISDSQEGSFSNEQNRVASDT